MTIIFDIIFIILSILYIPYVLIKGKLHKGFLARLGLVPVIPKGQIKKEKRMWFHAVSVGEVSVVLELIKRMKQQFPEHQIILSTVTQTGNGLALSKLEDDDIVLQQPAQRVDGQRIDTLSEDAPQAIGVGVVIRDTIAVTGLTAIRTPQAGPGVPVIPEIISRLGEQLADAALLDQVMPCRVM